LLRAGKVPVMAGAEGMGGAEAIVLRTYPFNEADLLITLFTREQGKVRGIAKSAMKSRKRFGGALEPMTYVRAQFTVKPRQELVRMDGFEIVASPLSSPVDYGRATALAFLAEVLDQLLPDQDPHDAVFRLTLATLEPLQAGAIWLPLTYFSLWVTRLMGWLSELDRCVECGGSLARGAYFHATRDGLFCGTHKRASATALSAESIQLAVEMLRKPLPAFAGIKLGREDGADLRRLLVQSLERHLERKLTTAAVLTRLKESVK
jgi:DNA repair protein RecO (recombination protein O)